jgi:hypothetical protein
VASGAQGHTAAMWRRRQYGRGGGSTNRAWRSFFPPPSVPRDRRASVPRAASWGGERSKSGCAAAHRPARMGVSRSGCAARRPAGAERGRRSVRRERQRGPIDLHDWRSTDPGAQGDARRRPEEGRGGDGIAWGGLVVTRWGGWRRRLRRGGLSREVEGGASGRMARGGGQSVVERRG